MVHVELPARHRYRYRSSVRTAASLYFHHRFTV
jgi:hypothetical protein